MRVQVVPRLDLVELTVTDDGRPTTASGQGFGILGMTERAELLGGRLSAGPAVAGGWQVTAVLPAGDVTMSLRVLVADDQEIVRTGLAMILGAQDGIEVVATAVDGQDAVEQARRLRPDVCLLDIRMPRMNGIEATRALAGPDVAEPMAVVVVTTFDLDEYVYGALQAGARGFLLKDCGPELLTHAVRAAADGGSLIAPTVTTRLLRTFADRDTPPQPTAPLTEREEQVLVAVARGLTNHEVAAELFISLSTVKTHLGSLMGKLGVRNRVELALWAYQTRRLD